MLQFQRFMEDFIFIFLALDVNIWGHLLIFFPMMATSMLIPSSLDSF